MSLSAALKKKGSNPNKAQSPLKNLNFDMQYRSSTELANQFKIKREQLANKRNDEANKEHATIAHKRKNSEDFIPQQGNSKLLEYKSVIQSSSREEVGTSHMVVGKGQTKKSLFQSGESIQEKGIKLPMHNFRFQTSSQKGVTASVHVTGETLGNAEEQHDIQDLLNFEQVKRKSVLPATSLDQFLEEQQLQKEHDINDLPNCKQDIHARNLEEIKEVAFDKGQAVGPTVEGKKWVITGLRDAWRRHKQRIKERCFDKNSTVEDMLEKRPDDMTEGQLHQLIEYWKHPILQHATKENNEEPSKCEMFIATHTETGKEIQADIQVAIAELQNHQNSGETTYDAFTAVFGKEQPSRLRCYGCVGSNIASPIDVSSAQAVKGQNLPHSSGSTHDPILQKADIVVLALSSLMVIWSLLFCLNLYHHDLTTLPIISTSHNSIKIDLACHVGFRHLEKINDFEMQLEMQEQVDKILQERLPILIAGLPKLPPSTLPTGTPPTGTPP
ncbi:hypothetical protein KY285_009113 [Solanum tuberosum]|nr:hypothetical protein KY285_009113 [Solanum tuberosum]